MSIANGGAGIGSTAGEDWATEKVGRSNKMMRGVIIFENQTKLILKSKEIGGIVDRG